MKNIIRGTLIATKRACGKENCSTCSSGKNHRTYFISRSVNGKSVLKYIPEYNVKQAEEGINNYKILKDKIEKMSDLSIKKITNVRGKKKNEK